MRRFLCAAMGCSFLIAMEYAAVRPASVSLFLSAHGTKMLPYAWLAAVPLNLLLVSLYNRFLPKWGYLRTCLTIVLSIASFNLLCALCIRSVPFLPFLFYAWKEVYILLMYQQLWSLLHAEIPLERAKGLYGMILGVGSLGALAGSCLPWLMATQFGSERLLFTTALIYPLLALLFRLLAKSSQASRVIPAGEGSFVQSVHLIFASHPLRFILLIVILMQMSVAVIDYQFNTFLQNAIPLQDLRTQYFGKVMSLIHLYTFCAQFAGIYLLLRLVGLMRSHLFVPILLGINAISVLVFPLFSIITYSFVTIKVFDFSLFGAIKEMLYVPLHPDAKFRAKAVIDVFALRTAKAAASLLILLCQLLVSVYLTQTLCLVSLLLCGGWAWLAWRFVRSARAAPVHEM